MSDDPDWIDELYAEGATEVPPPALDDKIRAAARQSTRRRWYRNPGHLGALATAASLVIAVSVIYIEPDQSFQNAELDAQLDAPAPALAPELPRSIGLDADAITLEEHLPARHERETLGAAKAAAPPMAANEPGERQLKSEAAEQKSMLVQKAANTAADTAAEMPAAERIAPAPSTGRSAMAADEARRMSRNQLDTATVSDSADRVVLAEAEIATELAHLCGVLPGTEETRQLLSDESGWLVAVTVGEDTRIWRCVDGAWVETTSQQQ